MRKVSRETMDTLLADPFFQKCCICGDKTVQWHHNFIFGGQQCDDPWSILPLCPKHHEDADKKMFRERLDHIMLNRASEEELEKYSRGISLKAKRDYLNELYA